MANPGDPQRGVAYQFVIGLVSQADRSLFKVSPTLAAGDFKVSKDSGAAANLASLPTVSPAGSSDVVVVLSATEMTADDVVVNAVDAAGAEWDPVKIAIRPEPVLTEPAGVFAWSSATPRNVLAWLGALSSNEVRQTNTLQTLRNRADSATIATAAVADDGTTATRDSFT